MEAEEEESNCVINTISDGYYKWDPARKEFLEASMMRGGKKNLYQKSRCQGRLDDGEHCHKRVRTFCDCNPGHILC